MKYLNVILTIIAFCLVVDLLKNLSIIPVAKADVRETSIDVNIRSVNNYPIYDGRIPVNLK